MNNSKEVHPMRRDIACLGLMALLVVLSGMAMAQPTPSERRRDLHGEWTLWQLADDNWYFRLTVGALANVSPKLLQPTGFAYVTLGLSWAPDWLITPQIQVTRAVHEISLGLEGVGNKPAWVIEITPFTIEFEFHPRPNQAQARSSAAALQQPTAQLDQQVSLDLKSLVLTRLDDLLKASEQTAKDNPSLDPSTFRDPLSEFKKSFEASKMGDAAMQLDIFSVTLRLVQKSGLLKGFEETHLRTGLHRLVSAFVLFREQVQRQAVKVCTGLFVSEDQKTEEVLSPLLTEAFKKLTVTNRQTGAKENFTLKESRCF